MTKRYLYWGILLSILFFPNKMMAQTDNYFEQGGMAFNCYSENKVCVVKPANGSSLYYDDFEEVKIPENIYYHGSLCVVDSIGVGAFKDCKKLKTIQWGDIKKIGKQAFRDCRALDNLVIPAQISYVEEEAFMYCTGLKSVVIAEGQLETISQRMFVNCSNMEEITIPKTIRGIRKEAFQSCSSLKRFICLAEEISFEENVFDQTISDCELYIFKSFLANATQEFIAGLFGRIVIFNNLDHFVENSSGEGGLYYNILNDGNAAVTSDEEHEYDKYIGISKTQKYDEYTSITIPTTVTIENKTYRVTTIDDGTFQNLSMLTSVQLGENITTIGASAFMNCNKLYNPTLPDGLSSIGDGAFSGCSSFTAITIPKDVQKIGNSVFYNCNSLETVNFKGTITEIGDFAFYKCRLSEITLTPGLKKLGNEAFRDCLFKTVTMPNSLTEIGPSAFHYCTELVNITFSENITTIHNSAFSGCGKIEALLLPTSLNTIGENAFDGCGKLTELTIPEHVNSIGKLAFINCHALKHIYSLPTTAPQAYDNTFDTWNYQNTALHYAKNGDGYHSEPWSKFKTASPIGSLTYKLIYTVDGKIAAIDEYAAGTVVTPRPDSISSEGRRFSGWSPIPHLMPAQDSIITGGFEYEITFQIEEDQQKKNYFYDDSIKVPEFKRRGYTPQWMDVPSTMPAKDTLVIGEYIPNHYELTFKIENEIFRVVSVAYGDTIQLPTDVPQKYEYVFTWDQHPITMPYDTLTINGHYDERSDTTLAGGLNYRLYMVQRKAEVIKGKDTEGLLSDTIIIAQKVYFEDREYDVTAIGEGAFSGSSSLTIIELPNTLRKIGKQAFRDCKALTVITIPEKVDTISQEAFMYCSKLAHIYCRSHQAPMAYDNTFMGVPYDDTTVLHVPAGAADNYRNTAPWSSFKSLSDTKQGLLTYIVDGSIYMVDGKECQYSMTEGDIITPLPEPQKEGRDFRGWEGLPEDLRMPDSSIVVTGCFKYKVTFLFGDQDPVNVGYFYGEKVTAPEVQEKEGHHPQWNGMPETMPAEDIIVRGGYVPNRHVISYVIDHVTLQRKDTVDYGTTIVPMEVEPRDGYIFRWLDYPKTMPDEDITIEGVFTERIDTTQTEGVTMRIFWAQKFAEVIRNKEDNGMYTGTVTIPQKVTFEGREYEVTAIGEGAFSGSRKLTSIELPNTLRKIGKQAFRDCSGLTTFRIPEHIVEIDTEAFMFCTGLKTVAIDEGSLTTLSSKIFMNCSHLEEITIPQNILMVENEAFAECTSLKRFVCLSNNIEIGEEVFPDNIGNCQLLVFRDFQDLAYEKSDEWTKFGQIVLLDNLDHLVNNLYYNILDENNVAVTSDEENEYDKYINISKTQKYDDYETIVIPHTVVISGTTYQVISIEAGSFKGLSKLSSIQFGNNIISIGEEAFMNCTRLEAPTLPANLSFLGNGSFSGCKEIKSISIPAHLKEIDDHVFYRCEGLHTVTFNGTVNRIGKQAFAYTSLTAITLPDGLTTIDEEAFRGCPFTSIQFPNSMMEIGNGSFRYCTELTKVTFSDNIVTIGSNAFANCGRITSLALPQQLTSIGGYAFNGCSELTEIALYEEIDTIGMNAFEDCQALKDIYCLATIAPQTAENVFSSESYSHATLHYPYQSSGYQTSLWTRFLKAYPITKDSYQLTYRVDGEVFADDHFAAGHLVTPRPDAVSNEGRRFSGWNAMPTLMPADDITISGGFEYVLTCQVEQEKKKTSFFYGDSIVAPQFGKKGHHVVWDNLPKTMPARDITVTGQYAKSTYQVICMINDHVFRKIPVLFADSVKLPTDVPERYEYNFAWGEHPDIMPDYDVTVQGIYSERIDTTLTDSVYYRVYMVQKRAEVIRKQTTDSLYADTIVIADSVNYDNINYPVTDIDGRAFQDCSDLTDIYCFSMSIPKAGENTFSDVTRNPSATLHVMEEVIEDYRSTMPWSTFPNILEIRKFQLSYIVDGSLYMVDGTLCTDSLYEREAFTLLPTPEKEGRLFSGWRGMPDYLLMPSHDITLEGAFQYHITYHLEKDSLTTHDYFYGDTIIKPEAPEKVGHHITWEKLPDTMPAEDLIIQGTYEVNMHTITYIIDGEEQEEKDTLAYGTPIIPREIELRPGYMILWEDYPETMPDRDLFLRGTIVEAIDTIQQEYVTYRVHFGQKYAEVIKNIENHRLYAGTVTIVDSVLYAGVNYPVTHIADSAFYSCSDLVDITFPQPLRVIGKHAFYVCTKLKEIDLPEQVDSIHEEAFMLCFGLERVTSRNVIVPTAHATVFNNVNTAEATLFVPAEALEAYRTTAPWSSFNTILPIDDSGIDRLYMQDGNGMTIYTLQGVPVKNPVRGQYYIIVKGNGQKQKVLYR